MTHKSGADSTPTSLPRTPRLRRVRQIVSREEVKVQNSLYRSPKKKPSPSQMSQYEKENKKSSYITNSRNAYETAPTSPEFRTPQEVPSQIIPASAGPDVNASSETGPRQQSERLRLLKASPKPRFGGEKNASSDPMLRDFNVKNSTNEVYSTASLNSPNALGISGLSDFENKASTSEIDPSRFKVAPGRSAPILLHARPQNVGEPRPATSRTYEHSQTNKAPSRSGRQTEWVQGDDNQVTAQSCPKKSHGRSRNTTTATATQSEISVIKTPVKSSESGGQNLSQPSLPFRLSDPRGPPPSIPLPPLPLTPPILPRRTLPQRKPQQQEQTSQVSLLSDFDEAEAASPPPIPPRRRPYQQEQTSPGSYISYFNEAELASPHPIPPRQKPRRQEQASQGPPIFGLDGADDLCAVENSKKTKCANTGQSIRCEDGQDESKCVPITSASSVGVTSEGGSLLKRFEQRGVYTITYSTETEANTDVSDDEVESKSEAESLASYDDAEDGELELLEEQSGEKYSSKLEDRDLYQFRYFDEPEQDDKDGDVGFDDGRKYDVSMMNFVNIAATDKECGLTRNVEHNGTFINTHSNRIKRDLQQPEEANLGECDGDTRGGSGCVLPGNVVQCEDTDVWIDMLQAYSCDKNRQRSTYLNIPLVHQASQNPNFCASFSEIEGGCVRAEDSEEGGNLQFRAG